MNVACIDDDEIHSFLTLTNDFNDNILIPIVNSMRIENLSWELCIIKEN